MGNEVTTARGKRIDMDKLSLKNETIPAVGNQRVNARGDELGHGGKISKTREQVLQDYYAAHPEAIKEEPTNINRKR